MTRRVVERAWVTGAAQGIGRAIAESFAAGGARVAGIDLQHGSGDGRDDAPGVRRFVADVADEDSVGRVLAEIDAWLGGPPDLLCNVAATYAAVAFVDTPLAAFDRVMAVNVRGAFICGQHAARRMATAGGGAIVNITSTESVQAFALASVYGASKAALAHLTKSMAVELARDSIMVNAVAPGAVSTPSLLNSLEEMPAAARHDAERTPMGRLGAPEDIVAAVRFLACDATWMTGQTIYVDGGFLAAGLPLLPELEGVERLPESWFPDAGADDV